MGYSRWSPSDWTGYAKTNSTKKIDEVFIQKEINKDFDPKNITKRESRDSELKKIGRDYYSRLLKKETTSSHEEYLRYELYDKAVIFKISKTQFNKVEKAVARETLNIVKTI